MKTATRQALFWVPRGLCILFAVFLSLFALDVFSEGYSLGETVLALLIHLIPTFVIVLALVVAWRWERLGAILFIVLAGLFLVMSRGEGWIISGPVFLVGALFLVDWLYRARRQTG
jgi:hypothetical protein